jgi:DnaJ-class molecular chaperone
MLTALMEFAKRGPKPPKPVKCGWCGGVGTVPIKPTDRRSGANTCSRCGGNGEL